MKTVTNIGVGLTTAASNANWTQPAQQTTILDAVNPKFLRNVILSTNGVKVVARANVSVGLNIGDVIEAAISVEPNITWPPIVGTQPVDIVTNEKAATSLTISATVEYPTVTPISYQWQISSNSGANWANVSNASNINTSNFTTNQITFNNLHNAGFFTIRCIAIANSGTSNSNSANITTLSAPSNLSVAHPAVANFNVAFTGPGSFAYQWQISSDGGGNWANQNDSGVYSNTATNHINISNSTGLNAYQFRCATNVNGTNFLTSNVSVLTVT